MGIFSKWERISVYFGHMGKEELDPLWRAIQIELKWT